MRLGYSKPLLCAGALVVLAGCSDSGTTPPQASNNTVATPVRAEKRPRTDRDELDLTSPLGSSDDAAMLRSTPDYSITPTGEGELSPSHGVSVGSGLGSDPMLGGSSQPLPIEVSEPIDIDLGANPAPTSLESQSLDPLK